MLQRLFSAAVLAAVSVAAADSQLVKLLPADAQVIGGANVERAKSSPFGQYFLRNLRFDGKEIGDFIDITGFDPRRDVKEVLFAGSEGKGLIAVKGVFDQNRILNAARAKGGNTLVFEGFNVIVEPHSAAESPNGDKHGDKQGWVLFLSDSSALAGDMESVQSAVTRRNQAGDPKVLQLVADLSSKHDAWVHTLKPLSTLGGAMRNGQANPLQGVVQASGGVRFGDTARLEGMAVARSDKDATALHDVLKFVAGMVQLNREQNPQAEKLATLLDNLKISVSGSKVNVELSIPQAEMEKLFESFRPGVQRAAR